MKSPEVTFGRNLALKLNFADHSKSYNEAKRSERFGKDIQQLFVMSNLSS